MSDGPVPAEVLAVNQRLVEERNALRVLVDLLWGEMPAEQVAELETLDPEAVAACRQIHELVNHQDGR